MVVGVPLLEEGRGGRVVLLELRADGGAAALRRRLRRLREAELRLRLRRRRGGREGPSEGPGVRGEPLEEGRPRAEPSASLR